MGGFFWALAFAAASAGSGATVSAGFVDALVKVRPGAQAKVAAQGALEAARGECEGLQLLVRPPARGLQLTVEPLRSGRDEVAIRWYRQAFVALSTASNGLGAAGPWPDPLVPVEVAGAPLASTAEEPLVLYGEICVPASQRSGTYQGAVRLSAPGHRASRLPLRLLVHPFELPATSSLPNTFGISLWGVSKGHGLDASSPKSRELLSAYARSLLSHRVSAHGLTMEPPAVRFEGDRAVVDFTAYDAEVGPFLSGQALRSGARFTTAEVRELRSATDSQRVSYYRAVATHFRERGWRAQLFYYAKDEPKPEHHPLVRAQSARVRQAGVFPTLVTTHLGELTEAADILVPNLTCFFARPGPQTCARVASADEVRKRLGSGKKVWWYQSCNSHGCTGGPAEDPAIDRVYSGWASYMIDHPATSNRAMGPLAFAAGVEGELYFDTVHAFAQKDPWRDVFAFGGNGDGTLFYPGTPDRLGAGQHQPIESLRLKHLRDGLEDYEYLKLLESHGEAEQAQRQVRRLVRSGYDIEQDPSVWRQVRALWAARLTELWKQPRQAKRR